MSRIIAYTILFTLTLPSFAGAASFPDMQNRWYRYDEAVEYMKKRDVIGGYEDGTFRPTETINRAELLKIIFKGKTDVVPAQRRCFSDVNPTEWYAPYVCAAKNRGIVSGYQNGTFKPGEPVKFAEAIKIVLNAYGQNIEEGKGENWYVPYAEELDKIHVLPRHSYIPWESLNRERAALLLTNMLRHEEERAIPNMSAGCGKASLAPVENIDVNGRSRDFLLTLPAGYVSHDPYPLIIAFHGRTNSNTQVRQYMRFDREATKTIIAYPAAIKKDNGSYAWGNPFGKGDELRDLEFFDALVKTLGERYCIDLDRISVAGHSLGAWMANSIACARGGAVMASATVGGDSAYGTCTGPTAAMIAHNPKDTLSPFSGSERVRDTRLKVNNCAPQISPGASELNCSRYACAGGSDVLWCPHTIDNDERGNFYPHTWPRETARIMVDFFKSVK